MDNELERIWEEAVVDECKISQNIHGRIEENHERPQSL
jgi:hypothetical protein